MEPNLTDWQLVTRFAAGDRTAFESLVRRHVDTVYAAAVRLLGGPGREADDVTQAVFLLLSQKAARRALPHTATLAGWLYKATRYCCLNLRKTEGRRKKHEREAAMARPEAVVETAHQDLRPLLDAGLARLGEGERQAILIKFLAGKTAAEAGSLLGITAEAVEKRVERGVLKLRGFFAQRGFAAGGAAITTALAAEHAVAAPVGLVSTIGAGGVAGAHSVLIAKGAAAMMTAAKTAAVLALCASVGLLIGATVAIAAATRAALPAPASAVPAAADLQNTGSLMFARWDVLAKQPGIDRLRRTLTPAPSTSKVYELFTADSEAVRLAVREANAAGDVWALADAVAFSNGNDGNWSARNADFPLWSYNSYRQFIPVGEGANAVSVFADPGNLVGNLFTEPRNDAVRLRIDSPADFQLRLSGIPNPITTPAEFHFAGDIPAGHVMVAVAKIGTLNADTFWAVSVWETFKCTPEEWAFVRNTSATQWVEKGLAQDRLDALHALAWNKLGRPAEPVPAKWEKMLSQGGIVRVLGVSEPARWPDCWWDGDGAPLAGSPAWRPSQGWSTEPGVRRVEMQFEDPSIPKGPPGAMNALRRIEQATQLSDGDAVTVGYASGPWHDGPVLAKDQNQTVDVHGLQMRLKELTSGRRKSKDWPGLTWIHTEESQSPDVELRIVAIDKAGHSFENNEYPAIQFERGAAQPRLAAAMHTADADLDEIDHLLVQWRTREWTTFEGIAQTPSRSPDDVKVILPETRAAVSTSTKPSPTAPATADSSTPAQALRTFVQAAQSGDEKAIRAMMLATTDLEKRMADAMASYFANGERLRAAGRKKFGTATFDEAFDPVGLLPALHAAYPADFEWVVTGDTAHMESRRPNVQLTGGPGSTLIRVNGRWQMDFTLPIDMLEQAGPQIEKQITAMAGMGAVRKTLADAVAAGKFADVLALRDALQTQDKALQDGM